MSFRWLAGLLAWAVTLFGSSQGAADELRLGVFDLDATPPVGSPLAYDPMEGQEGTLRFKGFVFLGNGDPIVIAVVDWLGIGGEGHDHVRTVLAEGAGTDVSRVAVHCVHQHDAPRFDLGAERVLADAGLGDRMFNVPWSKGLVAKAGEAVKRAKANARPVTHVALGSAKVEKVASNRRILGEDGKVIHVRYTATRDPAIRAFPEGTIDPLLKSIAFHSGDELIAVATWYATHPQSYYRTRIANPDFPGMAREARQKALGVPHVHFNGAGGNIGAGKYNDGSPENRPVLAGRVEDGMKRAFEAGKRTPVSAEDLSWKTTAVTLPIGAHLQEERLLAILEDPEERLLARILAAKSIAFLQHARTGRKTDIGCLTLGPARILHMPGELFVEYQLAAQAMRPDLFVAMAAYGDYAPGYIGTTIAYSQGGYETSQRASRVDSSVEAPLMRALRELLDAKDE